MLLPINPPPEEAPLGLRERVFRLAHAGRRKFATAAAIALVCVVAFHVVFGANGLTAFEAKRQKSAELAKQIAQLDIENHKLADHNARLQADKLANEEAIRKHLHFTMKDEVILNLPESVAVTPAR